RDQSVLALDGHAPKGTHAPPSVESRRDRERAVTRPAGAPSTYVISLTPFDADDRLDEEALRGHLRRMAAAGVGVYLGGSGSGEGYTLGDDELDRIFAIGREELRGKVPVLAMGVEPRTAAQMIELGRRVADAGLDGMQVYSLDQG